MFIQSEDLDDTSDLSDSPSGEMADFCTEVPLLFYLDAEQSRRKASRSVLACVSYFSSAAENFHILKTARFAEYINE